MSLTIPVEDLNRLQVSSHISDDGSSTIDLSLKPPVSGEGLTHPSTKHCGIMVTFRRSVDTTGSGWSLLISTSFPNSGLFASGGNMPLFNESYETSLHELAPPSLTLSVPNELEASPAQYHSTTIPSHNLLPINNVLTVPEQANALDPDWLLQLMEDSFFPPNVLVDQVFFDDSPNNEGNNCTSPLSSMSMSTALEHPQDQQQSTPQSGFNSTIDESHDSVSNLDGTTAYDSVDTLFIPEPQQLQAIAVAYHV
ncbi:hypothetical protein K435DRAFT_855905 [Dendrothele bispora CBS 962.96]|uniref:Uncharacterized protein n=1 Tax=Dendrothele bispora (strain CBS 962.96) TaxID=1314807 RepID=A0A4S8M9X8_DENBC|nr:hypothetical protein K435DRAFT_855905 [Dendrothele bispora CBS 962.96]